MYALQLRRPLLNWRLAMMSMLKSIGRSNNFRGAVLISPYLFSSSPAYGYAGARRFSAVAARVLGRSYSDGQAIAAMRDRDAFRFAHQIKTPTLVITPAGFAGEEEVSRWTAVLERNGVQNTVLRYPEVSSNFFGQGGVPDGSGPWENILRWITAYAPTN